MWRIIKSIGYGFKVFFSSDPDKKRREAEELAKRRERERRFDDFFDTFPRTSKK